MSFKNYYKNGTGLATFAMEDLQEEIEKRSTSNNPFPLDVFNASIKPFINAINKEYDVPASFIGLCLLSAYSTAIGTAYAATTTGQKKFYLAVWSALVGLSSSGKSTALDEIFKPLQELQKDFARDWKERTQSMNDEGIRKERQQWLIYRDSHITTLAATLLNDNPKGLIKVCVELMEWINGMNQLSKKDGTDEQFWLSTWGCANYSANRSGKKTFDLPRPFVNIIGGIQYSVLDKLLAKDRDTNGFAFRILFAVPESAKITDPNPMFVMPDEWSQIHNRSILRLYNDLRVEDATSEPKLCKLLPDAVQLFHAWSKQKLKEVNGLSDMKEREVYSAIFGKIREYSLRLAAILHLADRALDPASGTDFSREFKNEEYVTSDVMERSLKLADYFFKSAADIYSMVQTKITAPPEVLMAAQLLKKGKSLAEIAEIIYDRGGYKMKASRDIKRWMRDYPRVFGAIAK